MTDPHPSASKRQRMEIPDEERRSGQEKSRHHNISGRAAAEGVAGRQAMAGGGKSQAKAEKETAQATGSAPSPPCRHGSTPGQAAGKREANATAGRRAAEKGTAQAKGSAEARTRMSRENRNWCNLSKRVQARHLKNDVRASVRSMIPGIGKITENGLMLQAAERIKQLEAEIDSVATHLERIQELQSSNGTVGDELENSLKHENVPATLVLEPITFGHQAEDGNEKLRSVLPQPTKAKGTRLLNLASEYMTELIEELDMKRKQVAGHAAPRKKPIHQQTNH